MNPVNATHSLMGHWGRKARATWRAWWHVIHMGAQIVVLALSPTVYMRTAHRSAVFTHLYTATAPLLTWFLVLSALVSLVLIRIVVATAYSYGLSQYALEVLVRTLVLELIPLYSAMFVAARYAMPAAQSLRGRFARALREGSLAPQESLLASVLLPRALAAMFSVLLLAALACVVCAGAHIPHGLRLSPWGLHGLHAQRGHVFSPTVSTQSSRLQDAVFRPGRGA
ncbi:MAG: ABC transporter permease [Agrobacterium sp.]|nr:ABC transporter permease [Agrobacterium sp.]